MSVANAGKSIQLKYGKEVHALQVDTLHPDPVQACAKHLRIPRDKFSMIGKGGKKIQTAEDFYTFLQSSNEKQPVFLCVGQQQEDDTGCDPQDIDVVMKQCGVDRNTAVRALRESNFDLIDAILKVG
jgi:hypothetical protein